MDLDGPGVPPLPERGSWRTDRSVTPPRRGGGRKTFKRRLEGSFQKKTSRLRVLGNPLLQGALGGRGSFGALGGRRLRLWRPPIHWNTLRQIPNQRIQNANISDHKNMSKNNDNWIMHARKSWQIPQTSKHKNDEKMFEMNNNHGKMNKRKQ